MTTILLDRDEASRLLSEAIVAHDLSHHATFALRCSELITLLTDAPEAGDAEDAARYRWLREGSVPMLCIRADRWNGLHNVRMMGDDADAAIDRARSAKGSA